MSTLRPPTPRLFRRSTWREAQRVTDALRTETVGGALLLGAAVTALVWANTPWATPTPRCATSSSARPRCTSTSPSAPGPPTACWRSSSSSPGSSSSTSSWSATCATRPRRRCRSPPRSAASPCRPWCLRRGPSGAAAPATCSGLGHPDRDRHRLRAGGARRLGTHLPVGAAVVPADPGRRRRPHRHHDHRALLHRRPRPVLLLGAGLLPLALFGVLVQRRVARPGGCCSRSPRSPGHSCTRPASTPPWPASCSVCSCPCPQRRAGPRRAVAWPSPRAPASAVLGRRRRARVRLLRRRRDASSAAAWARRSPTRPRSGSCSRSWSARRRGVRRHLAVRPVHPRPARRRPRLDRRAGPLAPGRHRVHRVAADRRARLRVGRRARRARQGRPSSSGRSPRRRWPPSSCGCATASTARSRSRRSATTTATGSRTASSTNRWRPAPGRRPGARGRSRASDAA